MPFSPLQKPPHLRPGDRVAVVSPSRGGPGEIPARYEKGKRELEKRFGWQVVEMPHARADPHWLRTHPEARADDLSQAFADPTIRAVIAAVGGDDSVRVLPFLDPATFAQNPKVLLGYSDQTTLHLFAFCAGLQTFYGPSVMTGFAENGGLFPFTEHGLRRALMTPGEPVGPLGSAEQWTDEPTGWADENVSDVRRLLRPGRDWTWLQGSGENGVRVEGHLLGGSLEVLEMLKNTPWWPAPAAWRGAVFYFDTSEEAPTPLRVERWLRNYLAQGILHDIAALLVGRPCGYSEEDNAALRHSLLRFFAEEVGRPDLPIVLDMDFGHTDPMFTLPNGGRIIVDGQIRQIVLPEPATI